MNYSFCYDQLRLEALCQMSSFLSKMEEKSSGFTVSPEFPALLQSVQLQFLSGCFALGTQIIGSHSGANYEMQHYMVHLVIMLSQYLCRCLWSARTERKDEWIFNSSQMEGGETLIFSLAFTQCLLSQFSLVRIQLLWIRKESYILQLTPSTSRWCVSSNRGPCWKENIQVRFLLFYMCINYLDDYF